MHMSHTKRLLLALSQEEYRRIQEEEDREERIRLRKQRAQIVAEFVQEMRDK